MAGLIFTISILSILATVGFLFAWMVRLASIPENLEKQKKTTLPLSDLASEPIRSKH